MIDVKFVLEEGGIEPYKATIGAAAYDIFAPCDFNVKQGRQVMPLNIRIGVPYGYEAHIQSRSGFAAKGMEGHLIKDVDVKMHFDCDVLEGKIDSDYTGIVGVIMNNHDRGFWINKGARIAQMTFRKVEDANFIKVEELDDTERGEGGFGHTNK